MRRRVSKVIVMSIVVAMAALVMGAAADAQNFGAPLVTFHFEVSPRTFAGGPAVEGWAYNDGLFRITNVRLKVEVLDVSGVVTHEAMGWVLGDIPARGRAYFVVPVKETAAAHRVTVVSFDVIAGGS